MCAILCSCAMLLPATAHGWAYETAVDADTLEGTLPTIEIEAARAAETDRSAPFAVALLRRPPEDVARDPALSLQDVLAPLPGIFVNNRGHYALGERISIRGMGWRSAFGVRGVVVVMDGVPLTMPDGQAFADIVDPSIVRSAELIRGPASVYWGNAAGGVLFLKTAPAADASFVRARALAGSHGERHFVAEASFRAASSSFHLYGSHAEQNGYREYSSGRFERGGLNATIPVGRASLLNVTAAGAYQDTENPGSLTRVELETNRRMADDRYTRTLSGKESLQLQTAATLAHPLRGASATVTAYGILRNLDNPLPFAYVELDRIAGGARLLLQRDPTAFVRWTVGFDAGVQRDDRRNLNNALGTPGDERTLDQLEVVRNLAGFALASVSPFNRLEVSAGLRADAMAFSMDDHLFDNGDESGSRDFGAVSPTFGASYWFSPVLLYANLSTAFETPTTTELVNRPDATGGFNPDLDPQRTRGFEIGARGSGSGGKIAYDVALFRMTVRDVLVQYESQTEEGRTYFRNAGNNLHSGMEAVVQVSPIESVRLSASYTYNRLRFKRGILEGNELPGVPRRHGYLAGTWASGGFRLDAALRSVSEYFADETNAARSSGFTLLDLSASHEGIRAGTATLVPFVELANVLDATYNASVVVNANAGRFFEPGPGRVLRAGLNMRI